MYLGIDVGGTKTLVASLDDNGVIQERYKFPTDHNYATFLKNLEKAVDKITTKKFKACGIGIPALRIDRDKGIGVVFGNLPWKNVPIKKDVQELVGCPIVLENDANLAGLSEAMLFKDKYNRVLYITISTGIGTGVINNQEIDPELVDSEGGHLIVEFEGKLRTWESFASGRAIVERFGKMAADIDDTKTWQTISANIARGLIDLIVILQPEVIIIGGSLGSYFEKYGKYLVGELKKFGNDLFIIPPIHKATRPEDAVIYGCFDLAKATYGKLYQ